MPLLALSRSLLQTGTKPHTLFSGLPQPSRSLWGWLYAVFNRVDAERVKLVGPDRACAEWVLRSGGKIHWKGMKYVEGDYNRLPLTNFSRYKVETIDATDTAVMNIGFHHLGLKFLKKLILKNCYYLDDDALHLLHYVKDSLEHLEISSAGNVTLRGLNHLPVLQNLQYLYLSNLPEIRRKKECLEHLRRQMPNCDVHFPEAELRKPPGG
ncbi:ATP synthase subunit s, mitochondrial isoform X2 [Octopus sinensis]|uniref:ATP synthase subunit s, mitochondrial isoform X2 n=1 Tax=Octopus sinensis TaxID=2607531 RepID=A0A6P7TT19_9MOLL|nr:ATP synthase subunit s, mitochondrial isoform X2 [Octopus sinensis]